MEGVLQIAALLAALGGHPVASGAVPVQHPDPVQTYAFRTASAALVPAPLPSAALRLYVSAPTAAMTSPHSIQAQPDPWLSEDKFRHAAASWAAMVFTYAAARSVTDEHDVAIGIALPLTASFGIAKEVVDQRRGGPFSFRDLAADALGAGVAWLFLREVR